jgi:hypothetical protein
MPRTLKSRRRAPKRRPQHRNVGKEWLKAPRSKRAIQLAVAVTIIVHILLLWLGPKFESSFMAAQPARGDGLIETTQQFDIEITAEEVPPTTFVDVNPDAPENVPDETDHFADQNQQLAQEEAAEIEGDMPSTVGEEDTESNSIVSGENAPPALPVPVTPPTPEPDPEQTESDPVEELPALAQDPLSGSEKLVGDAEDSVGTNVVKLPKNPQADIDEPIEGVSDPELASPEGKGIYYRPNPNRPSARPNLAESQTKPAIFSNRVEGTQNIGVVAHDALKTTFGVYFRRMLEVIEQTWNADIRAKVERRLGFPLDGSRVQISFDLHRDGSITINKVDGNAGLLWNGVAVEAIAAPARFDDGYGEWADEMRVILGDSTPIRLRFYYR